MRVFVSEFLVGGASSGTTVNESMRREGMAMLQAVTADIARLPNWTSVSTLEQDLSAAVAGEVVPVSDEQHEAVIFEQLLNLADAVLIIAPETDGVLAERCRRVCASQAASWNCSPEAIERCGDKFQFAHHLRSNDLPTIPTTLADLTTAPHRTHYPLVLKPRDGAGSDLTFLVSNLAEWEHAAQQFRNSGTERKCISQPFVSGRNLSVGVNVSLKGGRVECMQVAEQTLSSDGRFHYLGGRLPARTPPLIDPAIERLVHRTCETIPGLAGYIGFDLLLPDRGHPLIVELNPRLTTSYVGYRQLYSTPLPQQWLSTDAVPLTQRVDPVEWDVSSCWKSIGLREIAQSPAATSRSHPQ